MRCENFETSSPFASNNWQFVSEFPSSPRCVRLWFARVCVCLFYCSTWKWKTNSNPISRRETNDIQFNETMGKKNFAHKMALELHGIDVIWILLAHFHRSLGNSAANKQECFIIYFLVYTHDKLRRLIKWLHKCWRKLFLNITIGSDFGPTDSSYICNTWSRVYQSACECVCGRVGVWVWVWVCASACAKQKIFLGSLLILLISNGR